MFTGRTTLEGIDSDVIRRMYVDGNSRKITALGEDRQNNHFYILKDGSASAMGFFNEKRRNIERVDKSYAYGIKPRNAEQAFALHAIQNPDINLVTICGVAGTGKTLLALAGALEQKNRYDQIILARPIVALSNKDLGFLARRCRGKGQPLHAAALRQPQFHQRAVWAQRAESTGRLRKCAKRAKSKSHPSPTSGGGRCRTWSSSWTKPKI